MHSCDTIERSQSSLNSHLEHPADPPQTRHRRSTISAHFRCLTPSPFAHSPISLISIFFLQTTHVPGNFIGILRQLNLMQTSPFVKFRFETHQDPNQEFCFSYRLVDMESKR